MQLRRKRALVVAGGLATLLGGAGALVSPAVGATCPANLPCGVLEATTNDLGIIPDPTRIIIQDIYSQIIFPDELAPVYTQLNTTLQPSEAVVRSSTQTLIATENQVSEPLTLTVQDALDETGTGIEAYCTGPEHDHKNHKNHKHCDEVED